MWPKDPVSVGYKATLERVLLANSLPSGSPNLEQFWETTKEIRSAVLGSTSQDNLGGFRRGDVYNSLAAYLRCRTKVVNDITIIWKEVEDQQLANTAQRLLKWLNYCYHFNQGRMFELNPGLASLDELDREFAGHLVQLQHEHSEAPVFSQAFEFPSAEALLTIDPAYIFEIRDSDVGADYFSSLATWKDNPSEETANVLLDKLGRYTSRLRGLYLERGLLNPGWYLRALIPSGCSRWNALGKQAVQEFVKDAVGLVIPFLGSYSLVGKHCAALYVKLPPFSKRVVSQDGLAQLFGIGKRVRIEAEKDVTLMSEEKNTNVSTDASFE